MGFAIRQSLLTTGYILAGTAMGAAVTLLQPGILPKVAVGLSRNMINGGTVAQSAIILGFHTVVVTFLPRYEPGSAKPKVLLTVGLLLPLVVSLLLCIPYYALRHWVIGHYQQQDQPLLLRYYLLLPLLTLNWSLMTVLENYLAARLKVAAAAFARELLPRAVNFLLLGLFALGTISIDGFMIGTALMYLPALALMFAVAMRSGHFALSLDWRQLSRREWREAAHFAWYHLLAGITFQLIGFMDALMLAPLDKGGLESVAVYTIAVLVASFIMIPYRAISSSLSPLLNRAYIEQDNARVNSIFNRAGVNMTIAGVFMTVLIGCNLGNLVSMLPTGYEAAAPLVLILMIGRLADIVTGLNNELLSISSRYKFLFRASAVLLVLFVALNRVLIPQYSFYGAAWSATLALVLYNTAKLIFVYRKFGLQPFGKSTLQIFVAGIISAAAGYYLPVFSNLLVDAVLRSLVITLLFSVMIILFQPSEDLKGLFNRLTGRDK